MPRPFVVAHVVPTGIRAEVGGFIADATPATSAFAAIADLVLVNPNVVNGALLNLMPQNAWYVEGYLLSKFFRGEIALRESRGNRVGVVIEDTGENRDAVGMAKNTIEAMRAISGIAVVGFVTTKGPIRKRVVKTREGAMVGEIENPAVMFAAVKALCEAGANAIAVTTEIKVDPRDEARYLRGRAPNPYGGLEAIISAAIVDRFGIPCAHAPLFTEKDTIAFLRMRNADPRLAGETVSSAYLGSVLRGLQQAPQPIPRAQARPPDLMIDDLDALVLPRGALGGTPALIAAKRGIPIIEVRENRSLMKLPIQALGAGAKVLRAANYWEAAGLMACLKASIDPAVVRRPLARVKRI